MLFLAPPPFGGKSKSNVLIPRTAGTNIGDMTANGGLAAAFDGTTSQTFSNCSLKASTTSSYVGKQLASSKVFGQALICGSNDQGYKGSSNPSMTINIRGKASAPASASDGTVVGTITFTNTSNESAARTIASTDLTTQWAYLWAEITSASGAGGQACAELTLYEWA